MEIAVVFSLAFGLMSGILVGNCYICFAVGFLRVLFVSVSAICETAEGKFEGIRQQMKELKEKVPADQYYR